MKTTILQGIPSQLLLKSQYNVAKVQEVEIRDDDTKTIKVTTKDGKPANGGPITVKIGDETYTAPVHNDGAFLGVNRDKVSENTKISVTYESPEMKLQVASMLH